MPTATEPTWTTERRGRNVVDVRVPYRSRKGWEWWLLLSSDRHWDNPKSDWRMQKEHLDEVAERGGAWVDAGDLFCAMQGKYDKRSSKSDVRPEHMTGDYLDKLVSTAVEWFAPYAHTCIAIGHGNHETGISKNHETNLIDRLVSGLNMKTGSRIVYPGYGFWVSVKLRNGVSASSRGGGGQTFNIHLDHGYGGGGPVTKDMIQHQRRSVYLPDADVVVSGHTHDAWQSETIRARLRNNGTVIHDTQWHLKLPTYKEEYGDGSHGWHVETGKPPKPQGAWWLRFSWNSRHERIDITPMRAL